MIGTLAILITVSVLVYTVGTAILGRISFCRKVNVYFRIAFLGFATVPLFWLARLWATGELAAYLLFDVVTHLGIGALFAQFICLPDRALTLRIIVEIFEANERGLSLVELNRKFSLAEMIHSRIRQMQAGEVLFVRPDGTIELQAKGLSIGKLVLRGRRFFAITSAN